MGTLSRKTPPKKGRSSAQDRRSPSKTLKADQSPAGSLNSTSPERNQTPRDKSYSHVLPTEQDRKGNGRVQGRSLIMWSRPRMAEKLLLHIHYECTRHKINVPWDAIAHRLHPGSSGAAVLQHVNRLRRELVSEGHLVPPVPQKSSPSSQFDPNVRGYIRRDTSGDDRETTRPVMFDERLDDAKFNLPDAFDLDDEEEQQCSDDMDATVSDDEEIELPDTPTPIRQLPRGPMGVPNYNMAPFPRGKDLEEDESIDDSENCDGFANSFTFGHQEAATPPNPSIYTTPKSRHVYDTADDDSSFNHSFEERPILPCDEHGEEQRSAKCRGAHETQYPGYGYYPPYEGMYHPGFYGLAAGHGYPMSYPMGFPMPPYYPFDPRAPIAKDQLGRAGEMSRPGPENSNGSPIEQLMMAPNMHDEAINPELGGH